MLHQLKAGLSHLFYPHLCEGCSKPLVAGERVLCIGCAAELPETGNWHLPGNEAAQRFAGRIPFVHAASFAYFIEDGLLQHLLHGLKYRRKQEIGRYLGSTFGHRLTDTGWLSTVDMIVPVPLHPAKLASRGFNQSMLIAEGLAIVTGKPAVDGILMRTRNTESQTNKTRNERIANMSAAFAVTKTESLKNKHILLCDDVLTTGATIESCALALMAEKSIKISVATIGIAVS